MAKYAIGDEVILKCFKQMREDNHLDFEDKLFCGMRTKILEIEPNEYYLCRNVSSNIVVDENMILGKIGNIVIQQGLGIACRDPVEIERISKILRFFSNNEKFFKSISELKEVRIFYNYRNEVVYSSFGIDREYVTDNYNTENYNYIEFSDLAIKNEIKIRKLNHCKILYNDLAHCYCNEECRRCNIEV